MSRLRDPDRPSGSINKPYDYLNDNRYAMANVNKDIQQARIDITRNGDEDFSITIYNPTARFIRGPPTNPYVEDVGGQINATNRYTDFGLGSILPQTIWVERVNNGGFGTPLKILYADKYQTAFNSYWWTENFVFTTDEKGIGEHPNPAGGGQDRRNYCQVTTSRGVNQQTFECAFPVLAGTIS